MSTCHRQTHTHTCIISLLIDDTSVCPVWLVCVLLFTVNKQLHKCFFCLSPSQNLHYLMSTLIYFYLCLFVGGKSQLVGVVWLLKTGVGMPVALGSVEDLFLHACHSNSSQSQLLQGSAEDQALRSSESCLFVAGTWRRGASKIWCQLFAVVVEIM